MQQMQGIVSHDARHNGTSHQCGFGFGVALFVVVQLGFGHLCPPLFGTGVYHMVRFLGRLAQSGIKIARSVRYLRCERFLEHADGVLRGDVPCGEAAHAVRENECSLCLGQIQNRNGVLIG